jgi:hypothetical protein
MFELLLWFYNFRVNQVYPNPNPIWRVPELSGRHFLMLLSGSESYYPNFSKPEIPDPNFSGNPNAQGDLCLCRKHHSLRQLYGEVGLRWASKQALTVAPANQQSSKRIKSKACAGAALRRAASGAKRQDIGSDCVVRGGVHNPIWVWSKIFDGDSNISQDHRIYTYFRSYFPSLLYSRTSIVQAWGRSHYIISDKCYVSIMLQKFWGAKEKKCKMKKNMMRRKEK